MIDSTLRFAPNRREISHDSIDGEVILIHLRTGTYYSLEKIGAWIWSCITEGASFGEILSSLESAYSDVVELENALIDFFTHLLEEELMIARTYSENGLTMKWRNSIN